MAIGTETLRALVLLIAANATPVIVAKLADDRWSAPIDFGCVLADGERLFGSHKTWRGLGSGVLVATPAAAFMGLPPWVGAAFAATSLVADAITSAVKRRMKIQPGTECRGVDQIGESLLPLALFAQPLSLDARRIAVITMAFCLLDIAVTGCRHRRWLR
jgi:hypothetical protein